MTQVVISVNANGELVLPHNLVKETAGTPFIAKRNKFGIQISHKEQLEQQDSFQRITIEQWLGNFEGQVINGIYATEVIIAFLSPRTTLQKSIARSSWAAAILAHARLYDTHRDALTIIKFLEFVESGNITFPGAVEEVAREKAKHHLVYLRSNPKIEEIKNFRDTQWAHTDVEGVLNPLPSIKFDIADIYNGIKYAENLSIEFSEYCNRISFDFQNLRSEILHDIANFKLFCS